MAQRFGPPVQGPNGNEGNAALNSIIVQFKCQIKSLEHEREILKQDLRAVKKTNLELSSTVRDLKEKERKPGARQQDMGNRRTCSPRSMEKDKESKSPSEPRMPNDEFISCMISDKSLQNNKEVKKKFMDLASLVSDRLAKAEDLRKRERELEGKLAYSRKTVASFLYFLRILDSICRSSGCKASEGLPSWLSCILTQRVIGSTSLGLGKIWRLLNWNLHHFHDKKKSTLRLGEVDEWYALQGHQTEVKDVGEAVHDLYKEVCSYSNVLKEEGLSMSILSEFEDSPSSPESDESSLSSRIEAQDLMMLKSIIQGLVERFEELEARSQGGNNSDEVSEMDSDMYLPQWEALETYDLGKLIQTMNSVIQTLSMKLVTANSESKFCVRCQQAIGGEAGHGLDDGHPGLGKVPLPQRASAHAGYGLHSNESGSEARNSGHPYPRPSFMRSAVPPAVSAQPRVGIFHGATETLAPRNVTMLRTPTHLVRSKSDSSPRGQQPLRKPHLPDSLPTRPSSMDSVFTSNRMSRGTAQSPLGLDIKSRNDRTSDSDSDDEYEICGPPSMSPQVRMKEFLHQNHEKVTPASAVKYGHTHQKSDDSGLDGDMSFAAEQMATGEPREPQNFKYSTPMPYSQVQQCTGDSSSMARDIFLPSSVEWSTLQLREGGIKAPSPDAMDRYSTAMNLAEQSIRERRCVLCHKGFPPSESRRVVYDHIQSHLQPSSSPDSSLVTLTQHDGPARVPVDGAQNVDNCPVCNISFSANIPLKARESHINLHFESEDNGFEVLD